MAEVLVKANEAVLTEEQRRKGQNAMIYAAAFGSMMGAALGSPASLFLLGMGAKPLHIGVLATLSQMSIFGQIVGLKLIPTIGKTRLAVAGRITATLPAIGLAALAFSGETGTAIVWLAIGAFAFRHLCYSLADTVWWPLLQDCTVGESVGKFFARLRTRLRTVEILSPLVVGWYLGKHPSTQRFSLPFLSAALAMALAAWKIKSVPERPLVSGEGSLWIRLRESVKVLSVRRYVGFVAGRYFVMAFASTFWVVMLNARGLPVSYFIWLTSVVALGHVCALHQWGRLVDRHGPRAAITVTLVPHGLMGLAWLMLPDGGLPLVCWAVSYYLLWGLFEGGCLMGQTTAMMHSIPVANQAEGFIVANYANAISGMLGGLLGGLCFQWATDHSHGLWGIDSRLIYLAASQLLFVGAWWLSTRLVGYTEQTPLRHLVRKALGSVLAQIRG